MVGLDVRVVFLLFFFQRTQDVTPAWKDVVGGMMTAVRRSRATSYCKGRCK